MKTSSTKGKLIRRVKKSVRFLVLIGLVGGGGYYLYQQNRISQKAKAELPLSRVIREDLVQRVTISGTVTPLRKAFITAPYRGYVRKLFVKLGDRVKVGDPIASVSVSLASTEEVFPLRAPFSGRVVQVGKAEGEFVKEADLSDFIVRIDDLTKLFINANAAEMDKVKIRTGQSAVVKASAILDRAYHAVVRDLSLAATDKDRWERATVIEFPIRLELTDFDHKIEPGMSVLIDIATMKHENVLTLRHEFIGREGEDYFVTLKNGERRPVGLGLQNEEKAEITEGLSEGEEVRKVDFTSLIGRR